VLARTAKGKNQAVSVYYARQIDLA